MRVSKKLADLKLGDLVARRELDALERWVTHGIEVVEFERVGVVQGFVLNNFREVAVLVQWLDSPADMQESWTPSMLMKLSS